MLKSTKINLPFFYDVTQSGIAPMSPLTMSGPSYHQVTGSAIMQTRSLCLWGSKYYRHSGFHVTSPVVYVIFKQVHQMNKWVISKCRMYKILHINVQSIQASSSSYHPRYRHPSDRVQLIFKKDFVFRSENEVCLIASCIQWINSLRNWLGSLPAQSAWTRNCSDP